MGYFIARMQYSHMKELAMMNDQATSAPQADDQYADSGQPGTYCIKIYVAAGQVQSIETEDDPEHAAPQDSQAMPTDQALEQVRQLIEQGPGDQASPEQDAEQEAMAGYRSNGRRNVVGINDVFTKG